MRSIFFALNNCEEELCGLIPKRLAISLCDKPSKTESLNISRLPFGKASIADSSISRLIFCSDVFSSLGISMFKWDNGNSLLSESRRYFNARLRRIVIIQPSNFELSFRLFIDVKIIIKAS